MQCVYVAYLPEKKEKNRYTFKLCSVYVDYLH